MSKNKAKDAFRLIEAAQRCATKRGKNQLESVQLHVNGYAEPGYSGEIIATGDWNTVSEYNKETQRFVDIDTVPKRLAQALENLGVEIEWEDEWVACGECQKLVRTSADSYSWKASYHIFDGELLCVECIEEDPEEYLKDLEGNPRSGITLDIDPTEHGYTLVEKNYEHGFHPGQDADPKLVAAALEKQGITRYVFKIDNVGQFDLSFSVYVHEEEADKLNVEQFEQENTDGPSVSQGLKKALHEASKQMKELPEGGIKYAKVKSDGTAETRVVTPEEFLNGIKD